MSKIDRCNLEQPFGRRRKESGGGGGTLRPFQMLSVKKTEIYCCTGRATIHVYFVLHGNAVIMALREMGVLWTSLPSQDTTITTWSWVDLEEEAEWSTRVTWPRCFSPIFTAWHIKSAIKGATTGHSLPIASCETTAVRYQSSRSDVYQ